MKTLSDTPMCRITRVSYRNLRGDRKTLYEYVRLFATPKLHDITLFQELREGDQAQR